MYEFRDVNESIALIPLSAESLRLNGEYLETEIEGYRTLYVKGREALSPELDTFEIGTRNGSNLKSKRYPARTITVGYQLISESPEAFREAYNKLAKLLNVNDAELIFNDETDKFFVGTPSCVGSVEPGTNAVTGEIEFLCLDPLKYSITEYEAIPSTADPRSILVDYNGFYKSYPVLEVDFYKEEDISDEGVVTALTGSGDCGYVAFFNEKEKIIQVGDPSEQDGTEAYEKSQTLTNKTFEKLGDWSSAAKNLWSENVGKVIPGGIVQAGAVGMKVASYAVPATPANTSGTILYRAKSDVGSPYIFYTVSLEAYGRTANAVNIRGAITAALQYDTSYFLKGLGLTGELWIGGAWRTITIKKTSDAWRGSSGHTVTFSCTITGLSASTAALTGMEFRVSRSDGGTSGKLNARNCSNLGISTYAADVPETYYLGASSYGTSTGYHGPTITRTLPVDAAGETGAKDCTITYKQKLCVGNGKNDILQMGAFQAQLVAGSGSSRSIVAGVRILKNKAGKTASLVFYMNDEEVFSTEIDLSYNNTYFGHGKSTQVSTIIKSGAKVAFNIGGYKQVFTNTDIADTKVTQVTFAFEQYATVNALSYNGMYWAKIVKNNCDTWLDIPNKFSTNDVLEADCKNGELYLNGVRSPELGALGNDWEGFYLVPGLNQIGTGYSNWVTDDYAPEFKIRYREAFL